MKLPFKLPAIRLPTIKLPPRKARSRPPKKPAVKTVKRPAAKQPFDLSRVEFAPRPRAFTGCLFGILYLIVVFVVSFTLGTFGWNCVNDVLALSRERVTAEDFDYTEDMTIDDLSRKLKAAGIIEYDWLFRMYADFSNAESKMAKGRYNLVTTDYRAIVHAMNSNSDQRAEVEVTIREGLTLAQTFKLLEENKICTVAELEETAATMLFRYDYLKNLPAVPSRLEGYLFPATYPLHVNDSPRYVLQWMVQTFDRRFTADMRKRAESLNISINDVVIVASMIEMEATGDYEERKNVASVIYNRLKSSSFEYLQIDATIQYFLPERVPSLTYEHLETDNPYNTYLYPGLPPGPICNPSQDAIRAALYSNTTNYYYYLHPPGEPALFFSRKDDFDKAKQQYFG
ncbi:MAG: endolytic transglycosylase MltG [Oscillospiraceae bacterium]|jgi:UPF0755 protein|nr:endolytic transglycosylase MltG [Oscillospiraceae bacterium]